MNLTWRRVLRAMYVLVAVCTLAALPIAIVDFKHHDWSVHYMAFFIAAVFVMLSVPISIYEIVMHVEHMSRPQLQIRIIRILWMVPIYALDSLCTLRFIEARLYLDPIRECYEAFVIYNFYMFLIAYLEDEFGDVAAYYSTKADTEHIWGVQWFLDTWPMGAEFFWHCKKGVLGYVIIRPLMTIVTTFATLMGVFDDASFSPRAIYPYIAFVNGCSQAWALYCLVLMYKACKQELAPIRPLSKFACVKGVIFFTYWQGVGIALLQAFNVIKASDSWTTYDTDDVAAGLQVRNMKMLFDVTDVVDDVHGVVDETMQRTTHNLSHVTTSSWRTAKRTSKSVLGVPKSWFYWAKPRGHTSHQDDADELNTSEALLPYSRSNLSS